MFAKQLFPCYLSRRHEQTTADGQDKHAKLIFDH